MLNLYGLPILVDKVKLLTILSYRMMEIWLCMIETVRIFGAIRLGIKDLPHIP